MTGNEFKTACETLLKAIGNKGDNPDFYDALIEVTNALSPTKLEYCAHNSRVKNSIWYEIELHLNNGNHIENEELFEYAVALLEKE